MSEIKDAVQEIKSHVDTKQKETMSDVEKKFAAAEQLAKEANDKIEAEVKQLNEDMTKKGATLEEIQKEIKELKARRGRFAGAEDPEQKSAQEQLAEGIESIFDQIKSFKKGKECGFETKVVGTMTSSANLTGSVVASYSATPAIRGRRKVAFRDLVPTINSSTGVWKFYRQNTPVGEGSFGFQTTHGGTKAQLDYDMTEVTVTAEYLAGFVRIAKQMLQDLPFMQTYVANELVEDFKRQESLEFFGQLRSAATGSTTTSSTVFAERIIDWIATLMDNDWDPNGIVTSASKWAELLKTKPNDYSVPGGITISPEGQVMIAGIPVFVANSLYLGQGNRTIIGDWTKAAIIQTEGLNTNFYEQDSDNVQRNLITVKTEAREALAILRPDAFIAA